MSDHHWVVFWRVCFPEIIAASDHQFPRMPEADIFRFCPTQRLNSEGIPTFASDVWCGMAAFEQQETARAAFDDPMVKVPFLEGSDTFWTALAVPIAHRGTVNWRGTPETDSALRICTSPPEGVLAVVTSAGYDPDSSIPMERRKRFASGIEEVLKHYGDAAGNVFRDSTNGAGVDGCDGITLSLWDSDKSMIQAAYKPGTHRDQIDCHTSEKMIDRTSFSRFRVTAMKGDWGRPAAAA